MALHVVGVRHHSPACARLVEGTIRAIRPRFVLIEGPADMNGRLDELLLDHEPPIALFTFYHHEERTHASWSPFCRHSPEWVALRTARSVGATPLFIDLPAWTEPFAGVRNRYGDHHEEDGRISRILSTLCARFRVDDADALWDHLFELPLPLEELAARLDAYFEELRGDLPGGPRDGPREDFMLRWIGWALGEAERDGGDVLVVCGGFHAPVLRRGAPELAGRPEPPTPPLPDDGARSGTYLVPYSFRRLDSFTGYESGMPSPAFYDTVWEEGPAAAPERMLRSAAERLRSREQPVSAADLIAASTLAAALARTRGHPCLARTDLLDGLAGALVKDALDAPLPWSYRGPLRPLTDPLLVEVVAAFSGERSGRLDPRTPRPPLLADVVAWLAAHGLEPERAVRSVPLDLMAESDRERSRGLHRLRVLGIPGFDRTAGPAPGGSDAGFTEVWRISDVFERESALIEAAAWGATLESAAAARLEESLLAAEGRLRVLASVLAEAVFVGLDGLGVRVLEQVAREVHREPSFIELGAATELLTGLWRHDPLLGARGARQLGVILEAAFDRGLWLLEGIQGESEPADPGVLRGIAALRDLVRFGAGKLAVDPGRAAAVMERRAADAQAPPAVRGAALGVLWSLGVSGADPTDPTDPSGLEDRAVRAVRAAALPSTLGDFLAGLCALARAEVVRSEPLVGAVDEAVTGLGREDFLIALPALRLAFSFFPPAEREEIAVLVLRHHGVDPSGARALLRMETGAAEVARGLELEARVSRLAARFGLEDAAS